MNRKPKLLHSLLSCGLYIIIGVLLTYFFFEYHNFNLVANAWEMLRAYLCCYGTAMLLMCLFPFALRILPDHPVFGYGLIVFMAVAATIFAIAYSLAIESEMSYPITVGIIVFVHMFLYTSLYHVYYYSGQRKTQFLLFYVSPFSFLLIPVPLIISILDSDRIDVKSYAKPEVLPDPLEGEIPAPIEEEKKK